MLHPATADVSRITEIFSSLQGEGPRLGERHLFIRFEECHMHCTYCDELDKIGSPMSVEGVMETVRRLEQEEGPHSFVSLTGGEPLLYLPFLKPLLAALKAEGFRTYLETSGVLWRALENVLGWCDVISMDMKPASVTKEKNFFEEHRRFLEIAKSREVFVKVILSREIDSLEFNHFVEIIRSVAPETPLVLQPISTTAGEGHEDPELMSLLAELQRSASRVLPRVAIVPRFHKILKIR